jgi:polyisoprenoid-binding protein YceI
VDYRIDPGASRFTVRAFAGGMLSGVGHNPTFVARDIGGQVTFDPSRPDAASLRFRVGAASLALADSVSDRDRREIERVTSQDVLESATYPEILYQATRITVAGTAAPFQATVDGVVTLRGVSRPQQVVVRVYPDTTMLRAQGEVTLRQSDYRIEPVSVAGGMLKVKNEVKLAFDIVARPVPAAADSTPSAGLREVTG